MIDIAFVYSFVEANTEDEMMEYPVRSIYRVGWSRIPGQRREDQLSRIRRLFPVRNADFDNENWMFPLVIVTSCV